MSPSRVNDNHENIQNDSNVIHTTQSQAHHTHTTHQGHHYEVLHPRGLLHPQLDETLLDIQHHTVAALPEEAQPPSWPRPLPPLPWGSTTGMDTISTTGTDTTTTTGMDTTSTTDLDSNSSFSYTEETPAYVNSKTCSCQCHHRGHDLPPCYRCCGMAHQGRPVSFSGESLWSLPNKSPRDSLWTLPYTSPYTTCHTWKSSGNSTLDVRLPKTSSCVVNKSTRHKLKEKLAAENEEEKSFWWLADLENNLAWGVYVFHLGVIPLLLVYSGKAAVYFFILPIFLFFCGWIVIRRCGRAVHPCQVL
ncbi:unnamed protein product, partial [Meganyctiphanes norvegica]